MCYVQICRQQICGVKWNCFEMISFGYAYDMVKYAKKSLICIEK